MSAIDSCYRLVREYPVNPEGYFLLGMTYYSINNQYRNDRYADSVEQWLDSAIAVSDAAIDRDNKLADLYFVRGSAFGCRALFRSIHGGWWGAFRDGHHSCDNLEKAHDLDSSFTDALAGIGAYHYWKSAKAKFLSWLPFVSDRRQQGIAEILGCLRADGAMSPSAGRSLLPIYFNEGLFADVLALADSLAAQDLLDPNSQLHKARALIELRRWEDADSTLERVLARYKESGYGDQCGACEVTYLKAKILLGRGDLAGAREYVREIVAADSSCHSNGYFQQSINSARELLPK